jgi:hypothetical protein
MFALRGVDLAAATEMYDLLQFKKNDTSIYQKSL